MPFDPQKMKSIRIGLGLTQAEAGARIRLARPNWSRIESGKNIDNMRLATIENIAYALRCKASDLLKENT